MKTETTDKLGQEFLERQRQIIRDREEAGTQRDDLKAGWGKDALAKGNDNLPAPAAPFDANEAHMQLPPRLQKPAILTVEQLRQEVDNAVQDSLHQFEQDNSSLDLFYQSRRDADALVAELEARLAEARSEADELRSQGSPKQKLIDAVCKLELLVVGVAGAILTTKLQDAAQTVFHADYEALPKETQAGLRVQFENLRRYSTAYAYRFGRQVSDGREFSVEQVQARARELLQELTDLDDKELA